MPAADWQEVQAERLVFSGATNSSGYKFYVGAVFLHIPSGKYMAVFNFGAGLGDMPLIDGQIQSGGVGANRNAVSATVNKKLSQKQGNGYYPRSGVTIRMTPGVGAKLDALWSNHGAAATGPTTPKPPAATPANKTFVVDPVATLVSKPMTAAVAGQIVEQKAKLVALREKLQTQLDQVDVKIDMLDNALTRSVR